MLLGAQQYLDEVKKGHNPFQKSLEAKTDKCTECQIVLQEALTGYRRFNGNPYCSDHYFDELGAMVEKRPLGLPRSYTGRHALG